MQLGYPSWYAVRSSPVQSGQRFGGNWHQGGLPMLPQPPVRQAADHPSGGLRATSHLLPLMHSGSK